MSVSKIVEHSIFRIFVLICVGIVSSGLTYSAWNSSVSSGDTLTATLWNDLVSKMISVDSNLTTLNSNVSTLNTNVGNFSFPGGGAVSITGTMTAAIPTTSNHLTTKGYVDSAISTASDADTLDGIDSTGFIQIGAAIGGDSITDDTIDASELEANSVGNSELIDDPTVNTIYADNWFRSNGTSGWYSQTYGGGIHMIDSTWVRTYNNKWFYSSAGIRADGGGVRTNQICNTSGGNCVAQSSLGSGGSGCSSTTFTWSSGQTCSTSTGSGDSGEVKYIFKTGFPGGSAMIQCLGGSWQLVSGASVLCTN